MEQREFPFTFHALPDTDDACMRTVGSVVEQMKRVRITSSKEKANLT